MRRPDLSPTTGRRSAPSLLALVLLSVIGLVVLASGSARVRDELRLSLTRQPTAFLEPAFTDPGRAVRCERAGGEMLVDFELRSHLAQAAHVPYVIAWGSRGDAGRQRSITGRVWLRPGATVAVRAPVSLPAYEQAEVAVRLPGHPEHLLLHCPGRTR